MMQKLVYIYIVYLIAFAGFCYFHPGPVTDEMGHLDTIEKFVSGRPIENTPAMYPFYHHAVAFILSIFSLEPTLFAVRLLQLFIAFIVFEIYFFFTEQKEKVYLLAFLPLLFPYTFLVYTDLFALAFLLFAAMANQKKFSLLSALLLLAAILTRQSNVVWGGFLIALNVYNRESLKQSIPLFLVCALSSLFYLNRGLVFEPGGCYHTVGPNLANYLLTLLAFLILFFPFLFSNKFLIGACALFPFILGAAFLFSNTNPCNVQPGLKNSILHALDQSLFVKIAVASLASIGGALLIQLSKNSATLWLLILFNVIFLAFHSLYETRYFIPFFALFQHFIPLTAPKVNILSVWYLFLNGIIYLAIFSKPLIISILN